jgi:chemotaxis protein CheX
MLLVLGGQEFHAEYESAESGENELNSPSFRSTSRCNQNRGMVRLVLPTTDSNSYRTEIVHIVENVFHLMLGSAVVESDEQATIVPEPISSVVEIRGTWSGTLTLQTNTTQARQFALLFMGETEGNLEEESEDVMGELANIIAGNLTTIMPRGTKNGIPRVIRGASSSEDARSPVLAQTSFQLNNSVFSLRLAPGPSWSAIGVQE